MSFRIHALPAEPFAHRFGQSEEQLATSRAKLVRVDAKPGYPCRVSLADAEIGETALLINYVHQPAESPFQASHAIYVRRGVEQSRPELGEVPEVLRSRLVSVRGFDMNHDIVDADVVEGTAVDTAIEHMFRSAGTDYLHLHNAKLGCFLARVTRA